MASGALSRRDDPRSGRLWALFNKVICGSQPLTSSPAATRFIEAICDQSDPVKCIEKLISSSHGISALQSALRVDVSSHFLNSSASSLLRYLQAEQLTTICGGEFLRRIVINIVDPPIFWNALINAQKTSCLDDEALHGFSWLLLQLVLLPEKKSSEYYGAASDPIIQKALLGSLNLETRILGQKLKHIVSTVNNSAQSENNGAGGRHDNDFVDFRKIAILPTADEIASADPPFLRRATDIDDLPESARFAIHIDNHFRLYREDMLRDLREELLVALGTKTGRRRGLHIDGLNLEGIEYSERQPWVLCLQCMNGIPQIPQTDVPKRKKFIVENRNILKHQSLACLVSDGDVIALVTLHRNEDLLAQYPPTLCVQISADSQSSITALVKLKLANNVQLIQLNTAFFACEPVLKQLQAMKRMLLSDQIVSWKKGDTLELVSTLATPSIVKLVDMLRDNPSSDLKNALDLSKVTELDPSQAECFRAGLMQRLSLVQGPPGTGKSFIGALIAKAIFRYTFKNILVVCYTNHALDQFLEDLLKIGIPSKEIVRLGSASKSSLSTKPLLLSEQQSSYKLRQAEWEIINMRKSEVTDVGKRLRTAFKDYHAKAASKSDIMEYLEFEGADFHDAFLLPDDENGMTRVGKKGNAVNKYYLLDRWARGQDAGMYSATASEFPQIWKMSALERTTVMRRWKAEILRERASRLYEYGSLFNNALTDINALFNERDRRVIQDKRIIGCTTTAAAKYVQYIQSASLDVLLVEEAGEILESHIITALGPDTEQLILIGDHKQLRPKGHYDLSVEKGDGYDLNRSLFERLVLKGIPHQVLSKQHRMRPEISSLVRHLTYPELVDAPGTKSRPNLRGFRDNLIFLSHNTPEEETQDAPDFKDGNSMSSKKNLFEAKMTLKCIRYLGQQGYGTDHMVVLTPYLGQLRLLMDVLGKENDPILNDLDSYDLVRAGLMPAATAQLQKRRLRISTIDNYQGEESEIVVISLTRSNPRHDIGFMSSPERLNVLLSRARNAMIIIGNPTTFQNARKGKELWQSFMKLLKDGSHVYNGFPVRCERHPDRESLLQVPEDFDQCPDGGCNEPCNVALQCGLHPCPQRCHQLFDHTKMPCDQVVRSKCDQGHALTWRCHKGKPASCRACERAKQDKERKERQDFERQQKREQERQEHTAQLEKIDDEMRKIRESIADLQESEEMKNTLAQKKRDVENARGLAERLTRLQIEHNGVSATVIAPPPMDESLLCRDKATETPNRSSADSVQAPLLGTSLAEPTQSPAEREWERQKRMENVLNDSIDSLMEMTGLEQVKAQMLTIKARIDTALRQNTDMKKERFGIVLLGNPGTGKTTVARLYASFLTSLGVLPGSEFIEITGSRLASEGVAKAKALVETMLNAGGGAFFLDEAYQLALGHNYGGASVLDYLLAEIENQVGKIVFILAGYNKQMENFFEHNQGFDSRIPYRLQFVDYNDQELLQMLGQLIKKKYQGKMKLEDGAAGLYARIAVRRLGRGRGREGFGNARALQNMLAKISERQADRLHRERVAGVKPDDFVLTKEDLIGPDPSKAIVKSAAWREIQDLIGLKMVKESIQSLLDRIQTNYQRELLEKSPIEISLNRVFLGSPGTGKTSVGKFYGQILADLGLLSNGEVVTKNPSDFVGSVLGESEKNTKAILKSSEGKVLIIDEAYMLYSGASGVGNTSDPYKTAVVDTIVAEIQSTIGEDRCVLLLGYKEKLEEMFQNTNPGLSRRFPLDDAFHFEDFDDDQLRSILDLKLRKQDLSATKEAKDIAIAMLARSRRRLNFGNAGEVENMISHAKAAYQKRDSAKPQVERSINIVFEPQDFDEKFDRTSNASVSCRDIFKDVVGCDEVVNKLEGYILTASNMRAHGIDPQEHIPFNFIFKGPPGTGKTTTARKMGQVFYNMGFLSAPDVHDCSATDLVAGYVGQTGKKTIQLLEKALGQVLFIDEAYRLGEGGFAAEAINELVDSLTKPRFMGKIVVILAGYEGDMNRLLSTNPGLSSRFAEEVIFRNMEPAACMTLLEQRLFKTGITVEKAKADEGIPVVIELFKELSDLPGWGNGRDVQTLAKTISGATFRSANGAEVVLSLSIEKLIGYLRDFLAERRARTVMTTPKMIHNESISKAAPEMARDAPSATALRTLQSTKSAEPEILMPEVLPHIAVPASTTADERDDGVSDAIWAQLQADKAAQEYIEQQQAIAIATAKAQAQSDKLQEEALQRDAANLAAQRVRDEEAHELKRKHEEARLKYIAAQRAREEAEAQLARVREEAERRRKEEAKAQQKLRDMGVCVAGFRWIKQAEGYRCA
ncbi:hypothetical protein MMC26_007365, partial [Xylographa opegraphella]|nr:hypothetical protein [Xylographa opegraphella]